MHIYQKRNQALGFTIVEVIVVLSVIAILAAITIGSYTSIQNRSHAEKAKNNALFLQHKLQAYYNVNNTFPTPSTATTNLNSLDASKLNGVLSLGTPTTNNGETTISLAICTAGGTGYKITYWDFISNTLPGTPQISGGPSVASCTTWTSAV